MVDAVSRRFMQVDVFGAEQYTGGPLPVVLNADGLADEQMLKFAAWTNYAETTFVCKPKTPGADYLVRIFTPHEELPFAGHPTLGTAYAWIASGGEPANHEFIIQECKAGLIRIRRIEDTFSFRAPERSRTGPLDEGDVRAIASGFGIKRDEIIGHQWASNGPDWRAVQLESAQAVLNFDPDISKLGDMKIGVVGAYPPGSQHQFEVRAFVATMTVPEDPATGSVNASIAQWLIGAGLAPDSYTVGQGSRVGRNAVIHVNSRDGEIWVGGAVRTCMEGTVHI